MMQIISNLEAHKLRRDTMIKYLDLKRQEQDWHGVMDAAADLREIEVMIKYHEDQEKFNWQKRDSNAIPDMGGLTGMAPLGSQADSQKG